MPSTSLSILLLSVALMTCQSGSSTDSRSERDNQPPAATEKGTVHDRAVAVPNDFLIVPGERVGPIKATSSEANLLTLLGPSVVVVGDTIYGAEGAELIGTTLYKGTADEVQIIYSDAKRTKPETVFIRPILPDDEGLPVKNLSATRWATTDGLRIGTTLTELEKRNGKPFKLWGFAWDYGGQVSDWRGGRLAQVPDKTFLSLTLGPPASRTPAQEKVYNQLMGDSEFLSSDEAMKLLNPMLVSLTENF